MSMSKFSKNGLGRLSFKATEPMPNFPLRPLGSLVPPTQNQSMSEIKSIISLADTSRKSWRL